jgi:hypothetical protein
MNRSIILGLATCSFLLLPALAGAQEGTSADGSMTLKGDEETTALRSLTIEGEDRIQIDFERPVLGLDIDGYAISGLTWGSTMDVVQRHEVDLLTPLVETSREGRAPTMGRPWMTQFRSGSVARFRPSLEGVERWQLTIADSRGDTVRVFTGKGSLPKVLEWDGVYDSGDLASPGLVYSYVLEASDRAGNRRNFVGPGFEVAPYRIERNGNLRLVMSGRTLIGPGAATRPASLDDPWLIEAASWLNQSARADEPVEIRVLARNHDLAEAMGKVAGEQLGRHLAGPQARVRVTTEARSDAPAPGVVTIATGGLEP